MNLDEIMFTRTILKLNKNSLKIPLPRKKVKTTTEITHIHTKNTFIHFIHKSKKINKKSIKNHIEKIETLSRSERSLKKLYNSLGKAF